jgi:hypothetical protein
MTSMSSEEFDLFLTRKHLQPPDLCKRAQLPAEGEWFQEKTVGNPGERDSSAAPGARLRSLEAYAAE